MARSESQKNAIRLDPNRERLSVNMSVTPGDPTTQMNNPSNVTSYGAQLSAMPGPNGEIINKFPYEDKGLMNASQLGVDGGDINPAFVPRSNMPNQGSGTARGYQRNTFALYAEETPDAALMAAGSIIDHPSMEDKPQSFMGLTGQPANIQSPPGFNAGLGTPLPTMDQYLGMAMTPGATKQTRGRNTGGIA